MTDTEPQVDFLPALPMAREAARSVVGLRLAIADMDAQLADLYAAGDTDSILVGLAALRMLIRDFRTLAERAEQNAAELMGVDRTKMVTIDGVGTFERKKSTSRKHWQHDELARAVVAHAMDCDKINHPLDVLDVLRGAVGFSYWRVEPLREMGFEPDEWCDVDEAHYGVKITADTK